MITPVEFESIRFNKALRGYSSDEVDEFLRRTIKDYEALYCENQELQDKLLRLQKELDRYRELEKTLNDTLVLAQKASDDTKLNAHKEAELLIREAENESERILEDCRRRAEEEEKEIEELLQKKRTLVAEWRALLITQLELLERVNFDNTPDNEEKSSIEETEC